MNRFRCCLTILTATAASLLGTAHAAEFAPTQTSHSTARVVDRATPYHTATRRIPLDLTEARHIKVVIDDAARAATVVTKQSVEQRRTPKRMHVQICGQNIELDPYRNYLHEGDGPIDEMSMIPRAQSLWQSQVGNKARVIRHPRYAEPVEAAPRKLRTIILRTPNLMHEDPTQDNDGQLRVANDQDQPATAG